MMHRQIGRRDFLSHAAATMVTAGLASAGLTSLAGADEQKNDPYVWKAGISKEVITPETSVWLAGYGSKRAPDGKLHDLWMKAVALEDGDGNRVVLITSDFQGVPKIMSDRVFSQAKEKYQLDRSQIMFTFSHNHCGPRLGDDLIDYYLVDAEQEKLVAEYTDLMVVRTVELIGDALRKLAPASLQFGDGQATFAVNRRNNREADIPDLMAKGIPLVGPVDHTVGRDPVRLCMSSDHTELHDLVRRLSWLCTSRTGSQSSGHHGDVREHLRRRSESAAAQDCGAL